MTMVRMTKNDGFSRANCAWQKKGGIPPSRKRENAYEPAVDYGFYPLK